MHLKGKNLPKIKTRVIIHSRYLKKYSDHGCRLRLKETATALPLDPWIVRDRNRDMISRTADRNQMSVGINHNLSSSKPPTYLINKARKLRSQPAAWAQHRRRQNSSMGKGSVLYDAQTVSFPRRFTGLGRASALPCARPLRIGFASLLSTMFTGKQGGNIHIVGFTGNTLTTQGPGKSFLGFLKERHAAKQQELCRLTAYISLLEAQMAEDERLIQQVENYIKSSESRVFDPDLLAAVDKAFQSENTNLSVATAGRGRRKSTRRLSDTIKSESDLIRELANRALRRAGRVLSGPEILSDILATGYAFESKNPAELIKKALKTAPLIERRGRGYWLTNAELRDHTQPKRARSVRKPIKLPG